MTPFETGPFVNAAFFCERVLVEADGVASYIRVVDRFVRPLTGPDGEPIPEHIIQGVLVLILKPGLSVGPFDVTVVIRRPSGEVLNQNGFNVHFSGGEIQGVNAHLQMSLGLDEPGIWTVEFLGGDQQHLLTKVPLELQLMRVTPGSAPG